MTPMTAPSRLMTGSATALRGAPVTPTKKSLTTNSRLCMARPKYSREEASIPTTPGVVAHTTRPSAPTTQMPCSQPRFPPTRWRKDRQVSGGLAITSGTCVTTSSSMRASAMTRW